MKSAILVDPEYLEHLERLHEEIRQARLTDSSVIARRFLTAAMEASADIDELLEVRGGY